MIYQLPDVALNPRQHVRDVIGRPLSFYLGLRGKEKERRIIELLEQIELSEKYIDRLPDELSGGERQTVAIARAVHFGAKILILDEPTSALGVRQTSNVLATIDKVRKQGIGVVFISHNVRHALAVGDRFTVLNRGKTLGTAQRGEISPEQLQDLMAGGQEMAQLEGSLGGTV